MAIQQDNTREQIENAIMEFAPMVTLESKISFDDVRSIIRIFMRNHPEIFWFSHQYRYDEKTGVLRFKYNFTKDKADFFKGEIEKVVKDDFQIDYVKGLSEIERLVYVYKWIVNRTTYNEYSSFNQTIYSVTSVLINRNSVCTGYAKTAQYLLRLVGIESELVFGKFHADKSDGGRHGWNIAKIDDDWYHVDFCIADKTLSYLLTEEEDSIEKDSILWNYFGVPTEKILKNRSIEFIESLPECNNALSNYPYIELLHPVKQLICCKSGSGTSSRVYLNSFNKKIDNVEKFATTMGRRWGDGGIHDTDSFACTTAYPEDTRNLANDDFATTAIPNYNSTPNHGVSSYSPKHPVPTPICRPTKGTYGVTMAEAKEKRSIWSKLFGKKEKPEVVNASAYAPAEIMPYKHFIVRVFIHRPEDSNTIDQSVKEVDKTAVKKAYKPLDIPIKAGDRITIQLSMTDGVAIDEPIKNTVWRGHYIVCDFGCEITKKNIHSVLGKTIIAINSVPCGDLKFTLDVVLTETPKVYAPVETRRYSKIFISYAHADYSQVRGIAEGCKMNGSDYFFDRHTLQAGDIFKDKILQYIDNADLFVLCWSKNAAESEWVQIERKHALELIERGNHQLAIYPLSMPPEAPLPADMSDKYNFATL